MTGRGIFVLLAALVAATPPFFAQTGLAINEERMFGVMPNYQTVNDPAAPVTPLTAGQKWSLAAKETYDPFNVLSAAFGAALSQCADGTPRYGRGAGALGQRFGAALGDFASQNFMGSGLLASALHQDPRYFRKGPGTGVFQRVIYSLSRVAVTRQDSGRAAFNASGMGGMVFGIAASNAYYPVDSRRGTVMLGRVGSSMSGWLMGNLLSEFWPDIQHRFFHRHRGR